MSAGSKPTPNPGAVSPLTDPEAMERLVADARARKERVIFTNGCFDILHRGHVEYLEQARRLGGILIVGLNSDDSVARLKGEGRPINRLEDRAAVLRALRAVDYVVAFSEDTPAALIRRLSPDVLVKGGDYRPEEVAGGDWVTSHGGEVLILPIVAGQSTTRIVNRLKRPGSGRGS